jgi:hypothetical protein
VPPVAVNVVEPPVQTEVEEALAIIAGNGLTVIVTLSFTLQPAEVPVTV